MTKDEVFAVARAIAIANHHPDPDSYAQSAADAYDSTATAPAAPVAPADPAA